MDESSTPHEIAPPGDNTSRRRYHPALWTALIVPFGAVGGFTGVVLAFFATKRGLTVEEGASLIAVGMLPHAWKFLWAPVADMTLSRRTWYVLSSLCCIFGIVALSSIPLGPDTLGVMRAVIFTVNLATTFLGMAVEGLMAHLTHGEDRGRAGGWFQAGNLGGNGIGGGLGLWLASNQPALLAQEHPGALTSSLASFWASIPGDPQIKSGAALAVVFALCGLALLPLPDVERERSENGILTAVKAIVVDFWLILKSKDGLLAALICFLPIGTGAATGVLAQAEVAALWGCGENEVGLVNGVMSGFIAAFGCIVGGEICKRFPSRVAYSAIGALMAFVAIVMAFAPTVPTTFIVGGLTYAFVTGLAYAAFTGLVLETIGAGAAATKYNTFASLSNTPITYMGLVLAGAVTAWGPRGMLLTEAAIGFAGIGLFFLVAAILRRKGLKAGGAPEAAISG